jgi:hypothetical protein
MDSSAYRDSRVLWSFWIGCGLAATGAIAPLVLASGGGVGRALAEGTPFAIASVAMAANAVGYPRGRSLATALYILAWLAIVYGILRMVTISLQDLVAGGCVASDSVCTPGPTGFSGGHGAAIAIGVITGALALQAGYFGLRILYRGPKSARTPAASPPVIAPAPTPTPPATGGAKQTEPSPAPAVATGSAATQEAVRKPRTKRAAKPPDELPAPAEQAELPAHSELDELPAHEEPAELPPPSTSTSSS